MIRIWKVRVKVQKEHKPIWTVGIEEDKHNLITWKHWVDFAPEYSFFHSRKLQGLYGFMAMLLKIGNYSASMRREDKTHVYESSIIGISPYMLKFISNIERHEVPVMLKRLADLGYIVYTPSSRGNSPEQNILLNQYTPDNLKVFEIGKSWLSESLTIEKEKAILESEDRENFRVIGGNGGTISLEAGLPITIEALVGNMPMKARERLVENLPIDMTDSLEPNAEIPAEAMDIDLSQYEGAMLGFMTGYKSVFGAVLRSNTGHIDNNKSKTSQGQHQGLCAFDPSVDLRSTSGSKGGNFSNGTEKNLPAEGNSKPKIDTSTLSTYGRVVAKFYEEETGFALTPADLEHIDELLKISRLEQIYSAIRSAKMWRAGYPANFSKLSEAEKKKCIVESQPGFFLKQTGMKHVYNFVKSSLRFRKDGAKKMKNEVISGLDEQRVRESQRKIIDDIRRKRKEKQGGEVSHAGK